MADQVNQGGSYHLGWPCGQGDSLISELGYCYPQGDSGRWRDRGRRECMVIFRKLKLLLLNTSRTFYLFACNVEIFFPSFDSFFFFIKIFVCAWKKQGERCIPVMELRSCRRDKASYHCSSTEKCQRGLIFLQGDNLPKLWTWLLILHVKLHPPLFPGLGLRHLKKAAVTPLPPSCRPVSLTCVYVVLDTVTSGPGVSLPLIVAPHLL